MFLDISDHSHDIETNWSFEGIVYFCYVLDSARTIMLHPEPFLDPFSPRLAISQVYRTTIHDRD